LVVAKSKVVNVAAQDKGPLPEEPTLKKEQRGIIGWFVRSRVQLLSVGVFLVIWEIACRNLNPILMPQPSRVIAAFADLIRRGVLQEAFLISLQDMAYGYFIAVGIGTTLGIVMGRSRTAEKIISPYVSFFMATPTIALVPLVVIWFGFGLPARVFLVATVAIWAIAINTMTGIKVTSRSMREVAHAFRLSEQQFVRWMALPNALPYMFAGFRVALGRAVVGMIVAEMTMELTGLGGLVMIYGNAFKTAHLIAGVITSAVFAVGVAGLMDIVSDRVFPWIKGQSA
jgi:ABC-type nitrate/sulfonate/bicarbonate transport system permease component